MRQFVLPDEYDGSDTFILKGDDLRYITRVLRKQEGDQFQGLDSNGQAVFIDVGPVTKTSCQIGVHAAKLDKKNHKIRISLFQCIPKGKKLDLIIRQATETGIEEIIPVESDRAVPKFGSDDRISKQQRWQRIIRQAMQQSGCDSAPRIQKSRSFSEAAQLWIDSSTPPGGKVGLFFHQEAINQAGLADILFGSSKEKRHPPERVAIFIGPEGGFSEKEVSSLLILGFHSVYIKTHVLRTETAALYAIAAVQTVLLEKNMWNE